ncbi:dihydrolipoamide acetyltransferase family protein [Streptomyces sp. MST-110588]|uniref:dihydrolipoamide acetyltransferase family protein n=1 Tax=Streptomyces sp. MST-110588 TaxID=2833628 RepID=UPI001F5CD509|nr:dihydrolipoamide acetyltransferase family protein [Streptomyces sp. MST-110588]UNO41015.1 2-oxo acid dehydrogenase subunit E2 [Streptomyces sp. MST-110588]
MAEVREFALPDLGEGLTEATIVRWLVEVGEVVDVDQTVVEVETAKALVDVPCPYGGVVTARMGEEGAELPVGAPLLTVAIGSEAAREAAAGAGGGTSPGAPVGASVDASAGMSAGDVPGTSGTGSAAPGKARKPVAGGSGDAGGDRDAGGDPDGGSGNVLVGYGTRAPAARRRRIRPQAGGAAAGSVTEKAGGSRRRNGPDRTSGERTSGERTEVPAPAGAVPVISPLVRRLAREHGLDLREVTGSGADGLILRTDVERAVRMKERQQQEARAGAASGAGERIPLRGMRGAAAEKFRRSRQEIPDATCWVDADATELLAARSAMNVPGAPKVSVLALMGRIVTAALARFPALNSTVDTERNEIVRLPAVHLGFAAQTERGLVVPVVRDAHARTAEELSAEMARLTESARAGTLTLADLTHGTFTVNNYGVFGVDGSTPIINHPEAAMLGVGRITPKPWVHEGELAVRQVVQLSLTFDHRVCDGGTAGGFLRFVADCVERPARLLRTL